VADAGDDLDGGVRRDADLDRVAGRAPLEDGEEVLGEQPQVAAREGVGDLVGRGDPEAGGHQLFSSFSARSG
jgi:hypothetical protein